jgi:hypothetical protein
VATRDPDWPSILITGWPASIWNGQRSCSRKEPRDRVRERSRRYWRDLRPVFILCFDPAALSRGSSPDPSCACDRSRAPFGDPLTLKRHRFCPVFPISDSRPRSCAPSRPRDIRRPRRSSLRPSHRFSTAAISAALRRLEPVRRLLSHCPCCNASLLRRWPRDLAAAEHLCSAPLGSWRPKSWKASALMVAELRFPWWLLLAAFRSIPSNDGLHRGSTSWSPRPGACSI